MKRALIIICIVFYVVFLCSCEKQTTGDIISYTGTIKEEIDTNPEYSILRMCLIKSALIPSIGVEAPPSITLFAPTNDAMIAAGIKDTFDIKASSLRKLMDYLIITKQVNPFDSARDRLGLKVLESNDSLFVIKNGSEYLLNGAAKIVSSTKEFKNGLLFSVNKLPSPPFGNILGTLSANSNLTYLYSAIYHLNDPDINALINNKMSTLFAPTNSAFESNGLDSIALLNSLILKELISYHFTSGRLFTADLKTGSLIMSNNKSIAIEVADLVKLKGTSNSTPSVVVDGNRLANPGIIHVIDQVLKE